MLGYIFAIVSSFFYSLYVVPRKLSKLPPVIFSFIMSVGFSISSILLFLLQPLIQFHETPSLILLWSLLAGVIWATSFVVFVTSIDLIGLSRSNQWKNLQGPVNVVLSLLLLGEINKTNPLFAVLAAIAIFISALFFTATSDTKKRIDFKGVYLALLSALGFGSVATIQKYVTSNVGVYSQQLVWSLPITTSLFIYILIQKNFQDIFSGTKKDKILSLSAGFLYQGASLFQLFSFKYLVASISFTIIQMNALWTIMIGIFVFKEINLKKYSQKVIAGLLFTLVGIFLFSNGTKINILFVLIWMKYSTILKILITFYICGMISSEVYNSLI